MSTPDTPLGRRHLLTGAAAVGLGAVTAVKADAAPPEPPPPTGLGPTGNDAAESAPHVRTEGLPRVEALPPLVAGARLKAISAFQMSTYGFLSNSTTTKILQTIGTGPTGQNALTATLDGNRLIAPLDLEPGSTLVRIDFYGRQSGTGGQSYYVQACSPIDGTLSDIVTGATGAIGPGPWTRSATLNHTTQAGLDYLLIIGVSPTQFAMGALVQYLPAGSTFVPVTPYRAYDSRKAGVPSPGVITRLTSRVVNVVNAIDGNGAIAIPNVIPSTARAITYNLTATGTTADNYLSIAPGNAASTGVSSINFSANQSIANAATVSVDNGTVKVFCGDNTGACHFIIDVTGYYP